MGGSKQSSSGRSRTVETQLSRAQTRILETRERQYQASFLPALLGELEATRDVGRVARGAQPAARDVQRSFQAGQRQLSQAVAQRGLQGSGFEAVGLAGLQQARASALSDALFRSRRAEEQRRAQLIQMGGALSPTPTTAAPMGQRQAQSSGGFRFSLMG